MAHTWTDFGKFRRMEEVRRMLQCGENRMQTQHKATIPNIGKIPWRRFCPTNTPQNPDGLPANQA